MAEPKGQLDVIYQGYICGPDFSFSRSVGFEPNFGYVHIARSEFQAFTIETADGADAQFTSGLRTVERGGRALPGQGFRPTGDLTIRETLEGKVYEATFADVILAEDAIESVFVTDDDSDIVRVNLTDTRYLEAKRGIINVWINVTSAGATVGAGGEVPTLLPGSTRDGKPWTLRQVLEEIILPALPGAPPLRRMPTALADAVPLNKIWQPPTLPAQAFRELCDEFSMVRAHNLDGSCSLWGEQEGDPQLEDGSAVPEDVVSSRRGKITYHYSPPAVVVVGPPIRQTVLIDGLEPVGEVDGEIRPFSEAIAALGLDPFQARGWAVASEARKASVYPALQESIKDLDRWAFRWWRIPGLEAGNSDKVPIRDRGLVDGLGQFAPPIVSSEAYAPVSVAEVLEAVGGGTTTGGSSAAAQNAAAAAESTHVLVNFPFAPQNEGYSIDTKRGLVMFERPQGHIAPEGGAPGTVMLAGIGRVAIEFGIDLKPTIDEQPSLNHQYHAIYVSDGATISKVAEVPEAAVQVVVRPDLQEVRDRQGNSNRTLLDEVARVIAQGILGAPRATVGFVLELHRPVPLACTGAVRSITWSTESELPVVRAHIGRAAPFLPDQPARLETRAAEGIGSAHESIYAANQRQRGRA